MAAFALAGTKPAPSLKCYLDTSAVYPLAWDDGATNAGAPQPDAVEMGRAGTLKTFLNAASAVGADVRTSLLVLEEIGAKVRNGERRQCSKAKHFSDWKAYYAHDRASADADSLVIQAKMLDWMTWATNALKAHGVVFERRVVSSATTAATLSKKARDIYLELLKNYVGLDAMDALHIVVGLDVGATAFVSFDMGWRAVAEIDVYHD